MIAICSINVLLSECDNLDRRAAIERNRDALLSVVIGLFALAGVNPDGTNAPDLLPRGLWRALLGMLRTAEAAARRLIVAISRDLVVDALKPRRRAEGSKAGGLGQGFALFDPLPAFRRGVRVIAGSGPSICVPGVFDRPSLSASAPEPARAGQVSAGRVLGRMQALRAALLDLDRQARRLKRWTLRPFEVRGRFSTLRPGCPPGVRREDWQSADWQREGGREVDDVLRACHRLAVGA